MIRRLVTVLVAAAVAAVALAQDEAEDERFRQLAAKLRCLVCQNQTLADSGAELAGDLRRELREQIRAGRSDEQIVEFMVARYGDFVLYEPPLKATTLLLWVGPFALLALALGAVGWIALRRRRTPPAAQLSPEARAQIARLLGEEDAR
ncbi:MAG: cytochrome c-type biogenesis protein CcmH [Burkholderiales bacterium]|nr:cytochrome c-type biogenesis protein CcmH [Burkholderiales bacterium]